LPVRIGRFASVAYMVVAIYVGYKGLQAWGALLGTSSRKDYWDRQHHRSARLIRNTAVRLEGLLIKACQFAGSRADILPADYVEILSELHDRVPPRPFSTIGPWIEDQLGRSLDSCFAYIDPHPIAAASLAQVHRARLDDGREVAVKVQYPNIEKIITTDLANFSFFINLLAKLEKRFDLRLFLKEIVELIPLELDFTNEAANARRFIANFADDPSVVFPTPFEELSCRTVLTMTYLDGIKITDVKALEDAGIDKREIASLLTRAYVRQILEHGFFHGDPHPGNLLVLPGPVLAIVDLGLAKEFSAQLRNAVITLAAAIARGDNAAVASAFRALGFRTRSGKDETLVLIGDVFLGQAFTTGRAYANLAMVERIGDEVFTALRKDPLVEASADLLLVLRVMGLLSGIGKQLDSDVDPMAVLLPYLIGGATG
jgi:predicted unusual protein kinase regulating ubiquinone biosynthesis (AarF/ABC1/UbiB family)